MGFAIPRPKEPYTIKAKVRANVLTGVFAVFLAAVALAAILVWTGIGDRQPAPVTPPTPDPSTFEWHDVASWESSGSDDSPSFHVSADTWRVMWVAPDDSVGDGSFAVHVYNPDGLFLLNLYDTGDSLGVSFDGPLRGTLGLPGPGDYFLRVKTDRDYSVTIQELR